MTENDIATGYPNTWYAAAFSTELRRGKTLRTHVAGRPVLLYRTADGQPRAVDPVCPHLGADLGGGFVRGNDIVCPFHHFAFAPDGHCVRTGSGVRPPKAQLASYPVRERNGFVHVWVHHTGAAPTWEVPEADTSGYEGTHTWVLNYRAHPIDMIENAHDYTHFAFVHDGTFAEPAGEPKAEGHMITQRLFLTDFWFRTEKNRVDSTLTFYGPNLVIGEIKIPAVNARVLAIGAHTPRKGREVTGMTTTRAQVTLPKGTPATLVRGVNRLLTTFAGYTSGRQIERDGPIWTDRTFLHHQRVTEGEQHIPLIRRWAQQFYSDPA
ncbi:Rieske 2Fe-2S domain-containing protein [Streptomyces sp. NPDC004126]|uniref:Rieske 2Fe-2S domain-containing protein n=1 Tax=Streptomyces sp. NPDC004126 TaxID=3390695 RepID=UPI003CFF0725